MTTLRDGHGRFRSKNIYERTGMSNVELSIEQIKTKAVLDGTWLLAEADYLPPEARRAAALRRLERAAAKIGRLTNAKAGA